MAIWALTTGSNRGRVRRPPVLAASTSWSILRSEAAVRLGRAKPGGAEIPLGVGHGGGFRAARRVCGRLGPPHAGAGVHRHAPAARPEQILVHGSQRPSGAPLRRHGGQPRLSVDKRHVPARLSRPAPVLWGSCRGRPRCFCVGRPRRREISAAAKVTFDTLIDQNPSCSFGVRRTVIYIFKVKVEGRKLYFEVEYSALPSSGGSEHESDKRRWSGGASPPGCSSASLMIARPLMVSRAGRVHGC
jgi:hypothetical protein